MQQKTKSSFLRGMEKGELMDTFESEEEREEKEVGETVRRKTDETK